MRLQVVFDAHDPHALAEFWAAALGYQMEDNSEFVDSLVADGKMPDEGRIVRNGRSEFADVAAARDPNGQEPRFYFQKVPEGKTAKNRLHLDIAVPVERKNAEVVRLVGLGATELYMTNDRGPVTHTLSDPEGNEFCVH
ncbi:MAG: VOC family protein [Nakamurella sp.]